MSEDTISRQAALAYAISGRVRTLPTSEDGENWIRTEDVRQSLLTMPSAEPEIIHCRYCRGWNRENGYCVDFLVTDPNGYCSWGERRDDAETD